ncbi:MAG: hypothetical protein P8L77_02075 [Gammaproteobacteria bacterium]|nr:hypothetical protein [Gammaproteobacteria bacterium]
MQNLKEQYIKYQTIYKKFETNLKELSKYDIGDQSIKGFSPDKLNKVLNLEQQFNNVLIKRYETFAENPQQDPLFKDGAYNDVFLKSENDGTPTAFKYIILDTMNMFNVWYDQICYNTKINLEVNPLQRLNSDKKYAQSFEDFYDEAVGVLKNLDESKSNKYQHERNDKNLISKLAKNDKCSSWEYLIQAVAPSYLEEFIKPTENKQTRHLRKTLAATLDTHLIDKREYNPSTMDKELKQQLKKRSTSRPSSPDESVSSDRSTISSLTTDSTGYTTDENSTDDSKRNDRLKSKSYRSASPSSSATSKNTTSSDSNQNKSPRKVSSIISMFNKDAESPKLKAEKGSKGPKGPKK